MTDPRPAEIDAYDDGLALVLELRAPATEATMKTARALLDEWLGSDDSGGPRGHRNAGVEGHPGATRIVLWADRIQDTDGNAGATARLERMGERAAGRLELRAWRITSAEDASNLDLQRRLGTPARIVRAGGGGTSAVVHAAGGAPPSARPGSRAENDVGRPAHSADEPAAGGAPSARWTFPMFIVALAARWLPAPFDGVVTGATLAGGVAMLAWQTRERSPTWVLSLAAAAIAASVVCIATSLAAPELARMARLVALALALAWSLASARQRA